MSKKVEMIGEKLNHIEMKTCPNCTVVKDAIDELSKRLGTNQEWERYCPIAYYSSVADRWVIECQNCGFIAIFIDNDLTMSVEAWNNLDRGKYDDK